MERGSGKGRGIFKMGEKSGQRAEGGQRLTVTASGRGSLPDTYSWSDVDLCESGPLIEGRERNTWRYLFDGWGGEFRGGLRGPMREQQRLVEPAFLF